MLKAAFIAIGDEVLDGRTVNTNTAYLAQQWTLLGGECTTQLVTGDHVVQISQAIDFCTKKHVDIIFSIGGLGPTSDDRTREALSEICGWSFIENFSWLEHLQQRYPKINKDVLITQSLFPFQGICLENTEGTALGFAHRYHDLWIVSLPGVPVECKALFQKAVDRLFPEGMRDKNNHYKRVTVSVYGLSERVLDRIFQNFLKNNPQYRFTWGLYPHDGFVCGVIDGGADSVIAAQTYLSTMLAPFMMIERFDIHCSLPDQGVYYIQESLTRGLIQWKCSLMSLSEQIQSQIIFTDPMRSDYQILQEYIDGMDRIVLMKKDKVLGHQSWPAQGSLQKRQERCFFSVFGVIMQWNRDQYIVPDPIQWVESLDLS
jgi:molybdenum cofactor synthesis domain-containing protein